MSLDRAVVFPLHPIVDGACACGFAGCTRIGKHPAVLWRDLSLGDPVPRPVYGAGIGVKTGAAPRGSGIFVVDIDGEDAIDRWNDLDRGRSPTTMTVETGRGLQLYFEHPGFPVKNSAGDLAKGIDVRGDGGFVVATGSPHRNGKIYTAVVDVAPAPAAPWLLARLRERPGPTSTQTYAGDVDGAERDRRRELYRAYLETAPPSIQGQGGDAALWAVVQRGAYDLALPAEDVLDLVSEVFDPRCDPPWGDELEGRVIHKVESAKTASTRPAMPPLPADLAHLAGGEPAPEASTHGAEKPATVAEKPGIGAHRLALADRARKVGGNGVRLKTGLATLDSACRGGLLMRKVVALGGAPGAGKTALSVQLAFTWLAQGVPVGFLAADEDADGILIRLGQLAGLSRDALENGDAAERERLAEWCTVVPLILADADEGETIESLSKDLRGLADGKPSVLVVDSMQTARTAVPLPNGSDMRTRVNAVVRSLKHAAKVDGHLVVATSEISKAAYRNRDQAENVNPLSAFKESGDIEYGVGLALVLVNRQGSNELVDAVVAKNRLGGVKPSLLLKLDHARAAVGEISADEARRIDPLYPTKLDIRNTLTERCGAPMTKSAVYGRIGGRKETVLKAVAEMLEAGELFQDPRGVRFLLPGDPGYAAGN